MFNFIFDGKIGDILAPVVPTNKLFLAIQHHKNDEVQQLMLNNDLQRNADGGYAAIHVACRYNNRFALEMIVSRGVPVESVDQSGNTALHYACKYGHLDLCKYLIELRASPCRKNSSGQTPYDAAGDHHTVRQYMLPLQFQAERSMDGHADPTNGGGMMGISNDAHYNNNTYAQTGYQQPPAQNAYAPPPQYGAPPPAYYGAPGQAPLGAPQAVDNSAPPHNPSPPGVTTFGPPPAQYAPAPAPAPGPATGAVYNHARPAGTTSRIIQPDGFHSSASDPLLQKKYGHIQQVNNIAPPPTGGMAPGGAPQYNMYSAQTPGAVPGAPGTAPPPMGAAPPAYGSGVYSRYVPYDAHNNTAAPIPAAYGAPPAVPNTSSTLPTFLGGARPGLPTHVAPTPAPAPAQVQTAAPSAVTPPARSLTAHHPAPVNAAAPAATGSASPVNQFGGGSGNATPASVSAGNSAPNSQRLLGNRGLAGGDDIFNRGGGLSSQSGEEEVIITGSSSAVL